MIDRYRLAIHNLTARNTPRKTAASLLRRAGFSLLELLTAIVILTIVATIAVQALSTTLFAWKRATEIIDGIQHGDFAMGQLVSALDSTLYFYNDRNTYAFLIEKDSSYGYPSDFISFVTTSPAFMPVDSPFIRGPHRLELLIDNDEHGDPALYARPMPAIPNPEDFSEEYEEEPFLVARSIAGLEILIWDEEEELWTDEWEEENSIPERIQVTMIVISNDPDEEPMEFSRILEIPVFGSVQQRISSPSQTGNSGGNTGGGPGGNTGGGRGGNTRGGRGGNTGGGRGGNTGGGPGGNTGGGPGGNIGGNNINPRSR